MRNICFILFLVIAGFGAKAQTNPPGNANTGKISGKVNDASNNTPVDYATISIFKPGSTSPFNGASTDPKGNFKIDNIAPGTYIVTVEFLGYKKQTINNVTVSDANKNVSLGIILLSPIQNQLKDVVITAKVPAVENKIDKLVYNPANDLTSQGGVALDVLQKVPMVSVDINGNVELMGNTNIQFLINGKPSTIFGSSITDALQAIPASQIKNIEVITNPGAKYDAAGTGGIINIILKDNNVQGVNGSVNLSAGTRLENGSFNLNAKKGKIGVGVFFSGNGQLTSTTPSTADRTSYSNTRDTVTNLNQKGSSAFKRSGYRSGFSLNWDITPKDALTAAVNFNHFGNQSNGVTNQNQTTAFGATSLDTMSVNNAFSKFSTNSTDFSLAYKKTFNRKDQELDFLYNYSYSSTTNDYSQLQSYTGGLTTPAIGSIGSNPGTDKETDISIDYTQPITKDFTIETGAKATIEDINNSVATQTLTDGDYVYNPFQSYTFDYNRKIFAYYLSTTFSLFNNFLDGKAGVRYEYTTATSATSDAQDVTIPSYGIFSPSFVLSHKLDKTESIKFSYSYRLQRPGYNSLNPFDNISDPHNISTGDPDLKPELGHNFELGYNKSFDKGANIYIAAFYRYNTNDLQSFTTFLPTYTVGDITYTDVSLTQTYNIGREVNEGVNLYASLPAGKFTFRSNMFFADRITTNPGDPQVSGFAYRINLNASYDFGHDLAGEFFINDRSSQRTIQGTNPGFVFYNFALRKQIMKKKASIGLTAANPFNQYVNVSSNTYGPNFNQNSLRQIPLRSFGVSLTYKFGKMEFKKDKPRDDNGQQQDDSGTGGAGK
ncbi:TonB-dependent receptor domain-containing protein [Mucilaginibacter sp. X4EP1]|uniref:outer membrane beta-barrel family protein n=1 Tax=Mucilaginibacter sp. X4EP1 TaxID=2723092 RepID=UPI002169FCBC|nr:outer membrane beta-barrel family protein [Mucilaginibacter sp. X4EP1]MCS3815221.1 outer membrane receptor protein involved in Fe transport [Mucilaginibacter sp. X4EP1]